MSNSGYHGQVQINNDSVILNTFQPKSVPMHGRQHLEAFKERAESVGVGLRFPQWAFSVEVGSKMFLKFVRQNQIPAGCLDRIMDAVNPSLHVVYAKSEPEEDILAELREPF